MWTKGVIVIALFFACCFQSRAEAIPPPQPIAGTADPSFNTTNGPFVSLRGLSSSSVVWSVLPLHNGQVIVAGDFGQVEGIDWPYIARLNRDGSLDRSFQVRPSDFVRVVVEQPDGRILIGGDFNRINDQFRDRLARLEADGRILVGGRFNQIDGVARYNVARLGGELLMFDPMKDGSVFSTRVSTIAGHRYFLETRLSSDEGGWEAVAQTDGDGTIQTLSHQDTGNMSLRYFRLRAE